MTCAEEIQNLEQSLLSDTFRKNRASVSELLADEFREFGSSGAVYSKSEILALLEQEKGTAITMQDFKCQVIAEDVALVTYRSARSGEFGAVCALRSSLWIFRDARWQMVFHQGTRVNH